MDLGVLLGHACVPGTPLELPGELSCRRPSLPHRGHTQTQVEFVTLEPGPGRVRLPTPRWYCRDSSIQPHQLASSPVRRSSPTTNIRPGLIVRRATVWTVAGPKLSGVVWVWDDTQSSTAESQALKEA